MDYDWSLLPRPQRMHFPGGSYSLPPHRYIWLQGDSAALLPAGRKLKEALTGAGTHWELTAARGSDAKWLGAVVQVDSAQVSTPQGYHLTIAPDQIRLVGHDPAGAFYGALTVGQLVRQARRGTLPCVRITDWPDFPQRGVMLDISRDKVPTMETLYGLVDLLAEWKINQLQLYTEHTFAYRNHRRVWEKASPVTGEQILALDAYCRERFVELVPNQNSFGHMERWLRHPEYNPLAEAPEGAETDWGWMEPFTLCPLDPGSLPLLAEMYDELLPHFSSRQFNVGCDETVDLGRGRSREACQERGVGRVYLDFLLDIHRLVQGHGRTMQFWGDIIMHHPELIPELPGGLIALEWGYEAEHPFAEHGEKFASSGVPYYVCPGTSSWNTIAGRTENALGNLWNAAQNGLAHGAIGYLITDWGDNGHWQPLPVSYLGFAYGAAVSWAAQANETIDVDEALDLHVFRDSARVMGRLAYELGNAYKETGVLIGNASILSRLLLAPEASMAEGPLSRLTVEALEATRTHINRVMDRLPQARMARPDADLITTEFQVAADLLRHACWLGIARLEAGGAGPAELPAEIRQALATEWEELIGRYRAQWLARNREGGLADSVARMERLLKLYRGE